MFEAVENAGSAQATGQIEKHSTRWRPGQSGNPAGSVSKAEMARRVAEMAESLASEFGGLGALTPAERLLITGAAEGAVDLAAMPVRRPRGGETDAVRVRIRNSIQRSLSIVRKGKRRITRFAR
jgi:hypothetical protein